jgi:hypothetical protein
MPAKKKFPQTTHKRITRPDGEQLAILEKAIYHGYKMCFIADQESVSNIFYDGLPVNVKGGGPLELDKFFSLIVKIYSTL